MKNKIMAFFAAALALALASCSSMKQLFDLNGIIVSVNDQRFTGKTAEVPMDIKTGNLRYNFRATPDPVDNGTAVNVTVSDTSVVSVTQSASDPTSYTITGLRSGFSTVTASCSIYNFTFTVYVADSSRGITVDKLKAQREAEVARAAAAAAGISLKETDYRWYLDSTEYYGVIFKNDTECVSVIHLEPPYEYRPATYAIDVAKKQISITYTGKVYFDEKLTKEYKDGAFTPSTEVYTYSADLSVLTDKSGKEYERR